MSEENPDTTAVPVTNPVKTHVKDPRRVESGRRLARISKEAKARKKAQLEAIKEEQSISDTEDIVQHRFYTVADAGPAPSRAPRFRLKVYDAILLIIIYIFSLAGPLTPRWRWAL
jgi:hypothetical protein